MRHVPEEELHAYLDQALSRSQCVEIETHLARCGACRGERDDIAALRDRTTALLGRLSPRPLILPPPLADLAERKRALLARLTLIGRVRLGARWAASLVAAVALGWAARSVLDPHSTSAPPVELASVAPPQPPPVRSDAPPTQPLETPPPAEPAGPTHGFVTRPADYQGEEAAIAPAPFIVTLASDFLPTNVAATADQASGEEPPRPPFDWGWKSVSWEEAQAVLGNTLPHVAGLPVVGVRVLRGEPGERPMVLVAQADATGELIHSIEGPAAKVADLLHRQFGVDEGGMNASIPARTTPDYIDEADGPRRGIRVLAVAGRLPTDSLNALARTIGMK